MLIGRYKQRACHEAGIESLHFSCVESSKDAHFKDRAAKKSERGMVPATSGSCLPDM
jgi:hypothetical protein